MKKFHGIFALAFGASLVAFGPTFDVATGITMGPSSSVAACSGCNQSKPRIKNLTYEQRIAAARRSWTPTCPQGTRYVAFKSNGSKVATPILFSQIPGIQIPYTNNCSGCEQWAQKNGFGGDNTVLAMRGNATGACIPNGVDVSDVRWCDKGRMKGTRAFAGY